MKYRSTHGSLDVCFELGGVDYVVPPGLECEIPDRWHPWVLSRGLMLEVVEDKPSAPAPPPEPSSAAEPAKAEPAKPAPSRGPRQAK